MRICGDRVRKSDDENLYLYNIMCVLHYTRRASFVIRRRRRQRLRRDLPYLQTHPFLLFRSTCVNVGRRTCRYNVTCNDLCHILLIPSSVERVEIVVYTCRATDDDSHYRHRYLPSSTRCSLAPPEVVASYFLYNTTMRTRAAGCLVVI